MEEQKAKKTKHNENDDVTSNFRMLVKKLTEYSNLDLLELDEELTQIVQNNLFMKVDKVLLKRLWLLVQTQWQFWEKEPSADTKCACEHPIHMAYWIRNKINQEQLTIGCDCIERFSDEQIRKDYEIYSKRVVTCSKCKTIFFANKDLFQGTRYLHRVQKTEKTVYSKMDASHIFCDGCLSECTSPCPYCNETIYSFTEIVCVKCIGKSRCIDCQKMTLVSGLYKEKCDKCREAVCIRCNYKFGKREMDICLTCERKQRELCIECGERAKYLKCDKCAKKCKLCKKPIKDQYIWCFKCK